MADDDDVPPGFSKPEGGATSSGGGAATAVADKLAEGVLKVKVRSGGALSCRSAFAATGKQQAAKCGG